MTPNPPTNPDAELDKRTSRLRVYDHGKLVKDQTVCFCGLVHIPPMTHELHEILIEEFNEALKCDSCLYGQYSPHLGTADKFQQLIAAHDAELLKAFEEIIGMDEYKDPAHVSNQNLPYLREQQLCRNGLRSEQRQRPQALKERLG